jgi:hypothetical protein
VELDHEPEVEGKQVDAKRRKPSLSAFKANGVQSLGRLHRQPSIGHEPSCPKRVSQVAADMINSPNPLVEKVSLFWHYVFATGNSKVDNCDQLLEQLDMFRNYDSLAKRPV